MGKLTNEIFTESCCDGGATSGKESAAPCGCDKGAGWICQQHSKPKESIDSAKRDIYRALKVSNAVDALAEIERLQYWESKGGL